MHINGVHDKMHDRTGDTLAATYFSRNRYLLCKLLIESMDDRFKSSTSLSKTPKGNCTIEFAAIILVNGCETDYTLFRKFQIFAGYNITTGSFVL